MGNFTSRQQFSMQKVGLLVKQNQGESIGKMVTEEHLRIK